MKEETQQTPERKRKVAGVLCGASQSSSNLRTLLRASLRGRAVSSNSHLAHVRVCKLQIHIGFLAAVTEYWNEYQSEVLTLA